MLELTLDDEGRRLRHEARAFVREDVPNSLVKDMDAEKINYIPRKLSIAK